MDLNKEKVLFVFFKINPNVQVSFLLDLEVEGKGQDVTWQILSGTCQHLQNELSLFWVTLHLGCRGLLSSSLSGIHLQIQPNETQDRCYPLGNKQVVVIFSLRVPINSLRTEKKKQENLPIIILV